MTPLSSADLQPGPIQLTNLQSEEVPQVNVESREHLGSMLELDLASLPDSGKYVYRWVHKSPLKVARAKAKGYVIVRPDPAIVNFVGDAPDTAEDGTITVGDVVLMRTLKALHTSRSRQKAQKTKGRLKGQTKKFKREAQSQGLRRYGVPVEVITDKDPQGSKE